MDQQTAITEKDRDLANACKNCPVCRRARDKQKGVAYWFVKHIEGGFCPACQSYERVYERKAHEPVQ